MRGGLSSMCCSGHTPRIGLDSLILNDYGPACMHKPHISTYTHTCTCTNTWCAIPCCIAICKVIDGMIKKGAATVTLDTDEVGPMGAGDVAFERGHYCFFDKDGKVFDAGK